MDEKNFRNFEKDNKKIKTLYQDQKKYQSLEFYEFAVDKYCKFNKTSNFWDLFDLLDNFIDLSDPDITLPNKQHLYQTAEKLRKDNQPEWLQVVGLIHDLGKILYLNGKDMDGTSLKTQWGIVGDTFILGCKIPDSVIYPEFNKLSKYHKYTDCGIYSKNCGLQKVKCSFGHDEYLYRLLKHNNINLPEEAYYIIRYHSLYLWHYNDEYKYLENEKDKEMKKWVKLFQKYDLYTKSEKKINEFEIKNYYENLINKYFPKKILY